MRRLAAVLVFLAALTSPAAAEDILSYDVVVDVREDGSLDVTETIRVTVEGDQVKRGIYRDFPVEYREDDGRISLASFDVESVRRNGENEPYRVERMGAYQRVWIGDKDVFLPVQSEQVYELRYRTRGQLRSHGDYDELYWNVTGNQWDFPIRAASVDIRLPEPVPIRQYAGYTGPKGATGDAFEVLDAADGRFRARITRPLNRNWGFTVAVAWPPGVVTVPPVTYGVPAMSGYVEPPMMIGGHRVGPYAALAGTLLGVFALFLAWVRVGQDPAKGAVYPQFDPPGGLSPAALRYVKRMGFDPRCLTAAILSMAVKGSVKIIERKSSSLFRDKEYSLEPLGRKPTLSAGESVVYNQLFPGAGTLDLKTSKVNGARMDRAKSKLKSTLWDEHYGASFRRNSGYTFVGILLGAVAAIVLVGIAERWNLLSILQWALAAVGTGLLVHGAVFFGMMVRDLRNGAGFSFAKIARVLPFLIFAIVVAVQWLAIFSPGDLLAAIEPGLALAGAAFGMAAALFHFLMAAPSKSGRKLLDEIEGFEMYLRTAEEDRLNILNPPERTPELFEKLLPHAVALGLAHEWSEKFADVLAAAAVSPDWYSGSDYRRFDTDGFEREFSHAVASTTSPPSRGSGGSGGGGSSGGGGGGGGGGGW